MIAALLHFGPGLACGAASADARAIQPPIRFACRLPLMLKVVERGGGGGG